MKRFTIVLITILSLAIGAFARPQYSILQTYGTKCQSCHVNTQGGGLRSSAGFLSRKDISLINPSSVGLKGFYDLIGSTNSWLDDRITTGFDFRYQSAKFSVPKEAEDSYSLGNKTERKNFLMQLTPYLSIKPFDWLELEGQYNIAYDIELKHRYPGQNPYAFSMYIKPGENLPQLRVGYFQPTIGTKFDDHSLLVRMAATETSYQPLIPDDYAEMGAQIDYEAIDWLGLSVGAFDGTNFARFVTDVKKDGEKKTVQVVDTGSISTVGRIVFQPSIGGGWATFFGAMGLLNNDFYITNLFFNIGMTDKFAVMTEYMRSEKKDGRLTMSFLAELNYQVHESVIPFVRAERAITKEKFVNDPYYLNTFIVGTHFFPLPNIDLLAEYRIFRSEQLPEYRAQWALQLHLFY
ncbi:MAG: hypothetical protein QG635_1318 [Bacteroidota bacterium]|nr:hypothetical protein [Bacteroidota bacterium]